MNTEQPFDIEKVIGFDALYESMRKCRCGVMWKDSTAAFCLNGVEKVAALSEQIHNGTYKAQPPVHFRITSPKPRDIASITFRDRVFQRSLNDNAVYPIMSRSFIYDNFACQTGKGTDAARERLKEFLREYYRKHGCSGYVAQFDIRGYYPNMDHEMTEQTFREKLPPGVYAMVETILREQYEGSAGYNPGSQLIQIAGISVLDRLDHYIKEQLHAHLYLRYMDDFLIIHESAETLAEYREAIAGKLREIRFELHPEKTRIYPLSEGIPFLGFRFFLTDAGRVLMLIDPKNVKRQRKKLRRLVARSRRGGLPKEKVDESYRAWRNHAAKGNSHQLLVRMDKYYQSLWREQNAEDYHPPRRCAAGPGDPGQRDRHEPAERRHP